MLTRMNTQYLGYYLLCQSTWEEHYILRCTRTHVPREDRRRQLTVGADLTNLLQIGLLADARRDTSQRNNEYLYKATFSTCVVLEIYLQLDCYNPQVKSFKYPVSCNNCKWASS